MAVTATEIKTKHKVTASAGGYAGNGVHMSTYGNSQFNYYFSNLLPATPQTPDTTSLQYFYRDMYLHDNIGGSIVDTMSTFPFSDWELRGLEDKETQIYNEALTRLNLKDLLPQISISYLVDGYSTNSLIYDHTAKNFMDVLVHDALNCSIINSPFHNVDPTINVSLAGDTRNFLSTDSRYVGAYLNLLPPHFVDLLKEGSFTLDPLTTLFLARKTLTDRSHLSYLHRLLPMYLIEKTMYRGTLQEAERRQRSMTHLSAGDDSWTPTSEELGLLVEQFQNAERDPAGGWISTRNAVQASDLRSAGDFWKWTDMSDQMVNYKLRALGISEAFLSGDTSLAASESSYSIFLETTNGYREHLTSAIFYKKLFPLLALTNKLYKDPSLKIKSGNSIEFLHNAALRSNLSIPVLHWHKNLTPDREDNLMEMLEKLEEKNVPVPLKMWLAAAGVDKDTLVKDAKGDAELRKLLSPEGDDISPEDSVEARGLPMSAGIKSTRSIMDRTFNGKPQSRAKTRDMNYQIAKIAVKADKDKNYVAKLKAANKAKGRYRLDV
jgi:hypothetical protein